MEELTSLVDPSIGGMDKNVLSAVDIKVKMKLEHIYNIDA